MKTFIKKEEEFPAFIERVKKKFDNENISFEKPIEYPCMVVVTYDCDHHKAYFDYVYLGDFDCGYDNSLVNKAKALEGSFYPITGGDSGHNVFFPLADGKNALVIHEDCEDNWQPHVYLISMDEYNSILNYEKEYKYKCW